MTIDINELRRLAQAVSGWSNCNQAWLDQSEDAPAAVVGHIDEDGSTYPVATIDCDQYYAGHQSLPLAKFYAAVNPAAVSELLDRLEAAESDAIEQARLNGMGSEREAALMAKLEATEKTNREWLRANAPEGWIDNLRIENEALRAKIEQMEQHEPVATVRINAINGNPSVDFVPGHRYLHHNDKLYLAPGAQNVLVEQDASVRKAWSRFSNELHRSPDAPYPGMSEAFEQHFSQSFTDRDWRVESGLWAAAWKAAKHHGAKGE